MHGLNLFFSRPSQVLVLRVLFHAEGPMSGREVERQTGLSNRAAMLALENLELAAVVTRTPAGRAHHFDLNKTHYLFRKALKPAFEAEVLFWDDLRKTVRRFVQPRPTAAVATGPMARDERLPNGKVELMLLFTTGRNRVRAFNCMDTLSEEVWNRYAVNLDPVLLDPHSANLETYQPLWRRIEREGILLYGTLP